MLYSFVITKNTWAFQSFHSAALEFGGLVVTNCGFGGGTPIPDSKHTFPATVTWWSNGCIFGGIEVSSVEHLRL